jgi:DNA primase
VRISQRSIEAVRENANIVEVASEFTALKRQGARFGGLCPYPDHDEKTPSFSVSPDQGFYYCFGCQRGGDAIKLVTELKSLSFVDAVTHLAERSGIELEYEGSAADSEAARERNQRRRNIHKALAAAAIYYHKYLLRSQNLDAAAARKYLEERGLDDSTIEEFRLGAAPPRGNSGFAAVVRKFGLDRSTLDAAGLLSSGGRERFAGRITFPISDRRGRMVGFGARAMGDDHPKYLNTPETEIFAKRDLLYGFPQVTEAIRKQRAALVVEGYTDVLMLYQAGIKNAVATLGTATTPAHLRTLSGYADKIYVLFDPDAAGEKAIERAAATASELKLDLRVLRLSKDPADWLLEHSPEEFEVLLGDAMPILEYGIRRIVERTRGAEAMDRSRAVPEIRQLVREISDPVLHREAIRIATEALGVGPEVFKNASLAPQGTGSETRRSRPAPSNPHLQAGRELLALILSRPDLAATPLKDGVYAPTLQEPLHLTPEDFADDDQRQLFTVLKDYPGDDLAGFLGDERVRPLMNLVAALSAEGERLYPSETALRETWLRLAVLSRQRAKRDTADYDEKDLLQLQIRGLEVALRSVTAEPS